MNTIPATPELDKQAEIIKSGKAGTIQDFIDWLRDEKQLQLGRYQQFEDRRDPQFVPVYIDPLQLMADFFGIDLNKIEAERRAIIEEIQRRNET